VGWRKRRGRGEEGGWRGNRRRKIQR